MTITSEQLSKAVTLLRAGRQVYVSADGENKRPLSLVGAAIIVGDGEQCIPPLTEGQSIEGAQIHFEGQGGDVTPDPDCYDWIASESLKKEIRDRIEGLKEAAQKNGIPLSVVAAVGSYGDDERVIRSATFPQFSLAVSYSLREPDNSVFSGVLGDK